MRRSRSILGMLVLLATAAPAQGGGQEPVREAILGFLRAQVPAGHEIVIPSLADFEVPATSAPVSVEVSSHPRQRFEGRTPLTVSVHAGSEELKRGVVTVSIEARVQAWASRRRLAPDSRIEPGDLEAVELPRSRLPSGALLDADRIVGRLAKRSIPAGGVLREDWVRDVPTVVRGQQVLLRIARGPLQIEAVGRARQDASPGERVRVLNVQSRREVVGVVGEDGAVHVSF